MNRVALSDQNVSGSESVLEGLGGFRLGHRNVSLLWGLVQSDQVLRSGHGLNLRWLLRRERDVENRNGSNHGYDDDENQRHRGNSGKRDSTVTLFDKHRRTKLTVAA